MFSVVSTQDDSVTEAEAEAEDTPHSTYYEEKSFRVQLPPGPVGVAFETAFNPDRIVVLKVKPKSFAALNTSLAAGDVLLAINDLSTKGMDFDHAMTILAEFQRGSGCVLTMQTAEEQERLLRLRVLIRLQEQERGRVAVRGSNPHSGIELSSV
jgi:C-terminal processing protease CtpA/Prc